MNWSRILDALVKYIGIPAFVLSVLNLVISIYSRRTKLIGNRCIVVIRPPNHAVCYVEFTLVNKSSLPVSVYSFKLNALGVDWASASIRDKAVIRSEKDGTSTHHLASALPIFLAGYASQRVSIQFDRRLESGLPLPPLEVDNLEELPTTIPVSLTLYTSRRAQTVAFVAAVEPYEDWVRSVTYGKKFE